MAPDDLPAGGRPPAQLELAREGDPRTRLGMPGYPCPCAPDCPKRTPRASTPCLMCSIGQHPHA